MQAHRFEPTRTPASVDPSQPFGRCVYCHQRRDVIAMQADSHPTRVACPAAPSNADHFCGAPSSGREWIDGRSVPLTHCELPAGHWSETDINARHGVYAKDGVKFAVTFGVSEAAKWDAAGLHGPMPAPKNPHEERARLRKRDTLVREFDAVLLEGGLDPQSPEAASHALEQLERATAEQWAETAKRAGLHEPSVLTQTAVLDVYRERAQRRAVAAGVR